MSCGSPTARMPPRSTLTRELVVPAPMAYERRRDALRRAGRWDGPELWKYDGTNTTKIDINTGHGKFEP